MNQSMNESIDQSKVNEAKQSNANQSSWQVQLVPTSSEHTIIESSYVYEAVLALRGPVVRSDAYRPTHTNHLEE